MIHEIWATNAEVQNIYFLQDGIVESIEEPGRVWYLQIKLRAYDLHNISISSITIDPEYNILLEKQYLLGYNTWLFVKTRYIWSSASGANPRQVFPLDAITPATNVPWPRPSSKVFSLVQFVRSLMRLKWGCDFERPVSNTATLTPAPVMKLKLHMKMSSKSKVTNWYEIASDIIGKSAYYIYYSKYHSYQY